MSDRLSIIVVEPDPDRAKLIAEALGGSGDNDVHIIGSEVGLARAIAARDPDIVIVDVESPSRDVLEELTLASSPMDRPVALFVNSSDDSLTRAAIEAGVSAYVVDGMRPDRIRPIIDAAIARFQMFQQMRHELQATKRALEERKIIDRAKGLIMKARGVDEDAAYAALRRAAMDQGKRVAEVAEALVSSAGLLS